jgi:hypothetical protein
MVEEAERENEDQTTHKNRLLLTRCPTVTCSATYMLVGLLTPVLDVCLELVVLCSVLFLSVERPDVRVMDLS